MHINENKNSSKFGTNELQFFTKKGVRLISLSLRDYFQLGLEYGSASNHTVPLYGFYSLGKIH